MRNIKHLRRALMINKMLIMILWSCGIASIVGCDHLDKEQTVTKKELNLISKPIDRLLIDLVMVLKHDGEIYENSNRPLVSRHIDEYVMLETFSQGNFNSSITKYLTSADSVLLTNCWDLKIKDAKELELIDMNSYTSRSKYELLIVLRKVVLIEILHCYIERVSYD